MRLFHSSISIGFSLIELMITIAIISILSVITYPQYTDFVLRTNRSEAQRELMRIAHLQESLFIEEKTYKNDMTLLGLNADPYITSSGLYSIDAKVTNNSVEFTLIATALKNQALNDTMCLEFMINHLGIKTATSLDCWE